MTKKLAAWTLAASLTATLAAATVAAHGPPVARDFETRLLADCVDDYFGGDAAGTKQGHDLISLDVQEQQDGDLSADVLRFHLTMNGQTGANLKDEIKFTANGAAKTITLTTTDSKTFTATGADRAEPAKPTINNGAPDGSRFYVDTIVKLSTLGLASGQKIAGFSVTSYVGSSRGDWMDGTESATFEGANPVTQKCTTESTAPYKRPDYAVRGPTYYVKGTPETSSVSLGKSASKLVAIDVENLLKSSAQSVTLKADASSGVNARFHDPATNKYSDTGSIDLMGGTSGTVHLDLNVSSGQGGTVTITLTTSLGGRAQTSVTVASTASGGTTTSSGPAHTSVTKDAPGIGCFIAALAIGGVAWVRRRRA